jgi:hypothetical protein
MRIPSAKRFVRAILARGVVRSGPGLVAATAASATPVRNSPSSTVHSGSAVKVRCSGAKAEPGKTEKTSRMVMVCERRVRRYQ